MVRGNLREGINYYLISIGFLVASFIALLWPNFPIWVGFFMMSIGVKRISCMDTEEKLQAKILFLAYALSFWALVVFLAPYLRINFSLVIIRVLWIVTQLAQLYLVRQMIIWYARILEQGGRLKQAARYRKNLNTYTLLFITSVIGNLLGSLRGRQELMAICFLIFVVCSIWMVMMLNRMPALLALLPDEAAQNASLAAVGYQEEETAGQATADEEAGELDEAYQEPEDPAADESGEDWTSGLEQGQKKRGAILDDEQSE